MSSTSEQDPTNPNSLAYYAPSELRERAKSLCQEANPESGKSPLSHRPSLDIRPRMPVYMRQPPAASVIHETAGLERESWRAALFGVAGRFAAVAAFVTVVALVFILMSPTLRKSDASSTSADITGSIRTARLKAKKRTKRSPRLRNFKASSPRPQLACLLLSSSPRSCFNDLWNGVKNPTLPKHLDSGASKLEVDV